MAQIASDANREALKSATMIFGEMEDHTQTHYFHFLLAIHRINFISFLTIQMIYS